MLAQTGHRENDKDSLIVTSFHSRSYFYDFMEWCVDGYGALSVGERQCVYTLKVYEVCLLVHMQCVPVQ